MFFSLLECYKVEKSSCTRRSCIPLCKAFLFLYSVFNVLVFILFGLMALFVFITSFKCLVLSLRTHSFVKFFVIRFYPFDIFYVTILCSRCQHFFIFFFRCHKSWFVVPCPADRYYITTSCSQCQHIFLKNLKNFFFHYIAKFAIND